MGSVSVPQERLAISCRRAMERAVATLQSLSRAHATIWQHASRSPIRRLGACSLGATSILALVTFLVIFRYLPTSWTTSRSSTAIPTAVATTSTQHLSDRLKPGVTFQTAPQLAHMSTHTRSMLSCRTLCHFLGRRTPGLIVVACMPRAVARCLAKRLTLRVGCA